LLSFVQTPVAGLKRRSGTHPEPSKVVVTSNWLSLP
jgi:hypothetical protein